MESSRKLGIGIINDWIDGEALHQPFELFRTKLPQLITCSRPGEVTTVNSFIQKQETITLPQKNFDFCGLSTAEQKQGIWNKKVYFVFTFYDSSKGVDAVAHVGVAANYIDSRKEIKVSIFKHGAPPLKLLLRDSLMYLL